MNPKTRTRSLPQRRRCLIKAQDCGGDINEYRRWLSEETGDEWTLKQVEDHLRETLPLESKYQKTIMESLKRTYQPSFIWKAAQGAYSRAGVPDICMIYKGNFFGFEVKRPLLGVPTGIQWDTIRKVRAAGGYAAIVSFPEDCAELIRAASDIKDETDALIEVCEGIAAMEKVSDLF